MRQQTFTAGQLVGWNEAHLRMRCKEVRKVLKGAAGEVTEVVGQLHDGGGDILLVQWSDSEKPQYVLAYNLEYRAKPLKPRIGVLFLGEDSSAKKGVELTPEVREALKTAGIL